MVVPKYATEEQVTAKCGSKRRASARPLIGLLLESGNSLTPTRSLDCADKKLNASDRYCPVRNHVFSTALGS